MEMALLGEKLPAETALQWGLVNRVVDDAKLMETAKEFAMKLATGPTVALSLARQCIWDACDDDFGTALHNERVAQRDAGRTEDFREGVTAFLQKRPAEFKGK
jgi:2-(1,2-epoxy-1,2-dihydrophenyl)acetyl-CoA isomerase